MKLMLHALSALLCIGASYGMNLALRPRFDTHYDPAEYAQENGRLSLSWHGADLDVPLMTTHIVTVDVEHMGRSYHVRELALRAAATGGEPRLELFADLSGLGGDLAGGAHDPTVLLQQELPLVAKGRLGARGSYVVLDGAHKSNLVSGNFFITDFVPVEDAAHPEYRAEGRVELQVETDQNIELLTGKWSGRIVWDATGT